MSIFDEYAPFVQDFIYRNGWDELRPIQVAAGDAIFHTDDNLLLTASTASGKTEAAFFSHPEPFLMPIRPSLWAVSTSDR